MSCIESSTQQVVDVRLFGIFWEWNPFDVCTWSIACRSFHIRQSIWIGALDDADEDV